MCMFILTSRLLVVTSHSSLNILPVIFKASASEVPGDKPLRAFSEFLMCLRESLIFFFFKNFFSERSKWIKEIKEELKDKKEEP